MFSACMCCCVCRYARKYLSNVEPELVAEFQEAMALLAFRLDTKCMKYRVSVRTDRLIHWYVCVVCTHVCIHKGQDMGWIVGSRLSTEEDNWVDCSGMGGELEGFGSVGLRHCE